MRRKRKLMTYLFMLESVHTNATHSYRSINPWLLQSAEIPYDERFRPWRFSATLTSWLKIRRIRENYELIKFRKNKKEDKQSLWLLRTQSLSTHLLYDLYLLAHLAHWNSELLAKKVAAARSFSSFSFSFDLWPFTSFSSFSPSKAQKMFWNSWEYKIMRRRILFTKQILKKRRIYTQEVKELTWDN